MKFYETIETLLKSNTDYIDQEGKLLKAKIKDEVYSDSEVLMSLLLTDDKIKDTYFKTVNKMTIFLKDKFLMMISDKNFLLDSYTSYKNKIGLTDDKSLIKSNSNVVLNFPFKDCYLEGGQSKDNDKSRELFFNEVLAKDELDRLLDPKGFVNCKRVDKNGESLLTEFTIDTEDNRILKDNLLIKGNNLLALHSLKKRFAGKVKLIYIDPPYNTGNDSFGYNDTFNHSSWLVFMKNRLEIAKDLLREDGVILVQIDNSPSKNGSPELGYLLVLMDEIFNRKNYITNFIWKKKGNASNTASFGTITESILCYAKNIEQTEFNRMSFDRKYQYKDELGEYNLIQPTKTNFGEYQRKTMIYSIEVPEGIFSPPSGKRWTYSEESMKKIIQLKKYQIENGIFKIKRYESDYISGNEKIYNNLLEEQGSLKSAKNHLESLNFNREEFETPKPEELLNRIIQIATKENDIVLDFFAGSGTTAAVAHKMKRQWITIEQMDYIDTVTKARLQKVLEGEQGGISKSVDWQGGGDFVSMELAPFNEIYKQALLASKTKTEKLLAIYNEMREKAFLDYRYDLVKELKGDKEFTDLDFSEQQRILIDILDKNQMYIPYTEIEDITYNLDQNDINRSHDFYKNVY